tara:strand:- start:984 stop:2144 length:1161 start_codon:yes stop_codon:yes gene_type:complete
MLIQYIKKIFLFFISTKYRYLAPDERKILIFDKTGKDVIENCLPTKDYQVLHARYEEVNLYCLFISLLNKNIFNGKIYRNYLTTYIKMSKPKIIISTIDNNLFLWELKRNFPYIKILLIQNGVRLFEDKKDRKQLNKFFYQVALMKKPKKDIYEVDYVFTINNYFSKKYKKFYKCKTAPIGYFRNNNFLNKRKKIEKNTLYFISQYSNDYTKYNVELPDKKILKYLNYYAYKKNKKLKILERTSDSAEFCEQELKYKNWKIYKPNKKEKINTYFSYSNAMNADVIVTIDSTLGYELLSQGKKVAFFSIRNWAGNEPYYKFGYPKQLSINGPFWSNIFNENKFERILDYLYSISEEKFHYNNKKVLNNLILFDKKNKTINKTIKSLL